MLRVRHCLAGLLLLCGLALSPAHAQWDVAAGGLGGLALAPASLSDNYGLPLGGALGLRYSLRERWRLTASVAYLALSHSGPEPTPPALDRPQLGLAPLGLGVEFVFAPIHSARRVEAYAGLELGYLLIRQTQDGPSGRQRLGPTGAPMAAPVVGLRLPLTDAVQLEGRVQPLVAFAAADAPLAADIAFGEGGLVLLPLVQLGVVWRVAPDAHPRYQPRTRRRPRAR